MRQILLFVAATVLFGCVESQKTTIDMVAEDYVKLVLEVGKYDKWYVDAYYGPEDWRTETKQTVLPYEQLKTEQTRLLNAVKSIESDDDKADKITKLRYKYLATQIGAVGARLDILNGKKLTFDEESKLLYDAVAPHYSEEHFDNIKANLESVVPGEGDLLTRLTEFNKQFIIPEDRLDTVFQTAINEARKRTLKYIKLPANENFTVEYVKDQVWGAYNWYKGNSYSLIQVNTDRPMAISRAIDLACHEGYPGHHVYNALLETKLYRERGWVEYCVYPLYSPQSFIAEGTANYGINVCFPPADRLAFEKEILFPLAGIDPDLAERYYKILELSHELSYSRNEAARKYFSGEMTEDEAVAWLSKYSLRTPEATKKSFAFIKANKSYIINYNYGQDMVKRYMQRAGAEEGSEDKLWTIFEELLSQPQVASNLE